MRSYTVRFEPSSDALAIEFGEEEAAAAPRRAEALDDRRIVQFDEDGRLVLIALLHVSDGVEVDGLPEQQVVSEVLRMTGVMTQAPPA